MDLYIAACTAALTSCGRGSAVATPASYAFLATAHATLAEIARISRRGGYTLPLARSSARKPAHALCQQAPIMWPEASTSHLVWGLRARSTDAVYVHLAQSIYDSFWNVLVSREHREHDKVGGMHVSNACKECLPQHSILKHTTVSRT